MALADTSRGLYFDDEEDLEKTESDVKHMAHMVSEYRNSLPANLRNTFESVISSHSSDFTKSDPLPFPTTITESEELVVLTDGARLGGKEQESRDGLVQLEERVCDNIATVPLVVKRMRDSYERINKSNSFIGTVHPAFTRPKPH